MRRYILKRVLLAIIVLIGVSMIVFITARLSGDVALLLVAEDATPEEIEAVRVLYGLDKPIPVQYYIFIKNAFHGDFGESIKYREPAIEVFMRRVPATLQLGSIGFAIALFLGILFGTVSATKPNSVFDWGGKIFAMLGQSMPAFWTGIMLILLFSVNLGWLPTSGKGGIEYYIMPVFSMSFATIAAVMRLTRSSMLDVLDSEYVKMAKIKGNKTITVIGKHALRNALIPVLGLSGMQLAHLIGGQVVIETIFRWPGVGTLMVNAIFSYDYPLIQVGTLIIAFCIVTVNLIVDLLFGVIDPRIRYE